MVQLNTVYIKIYTRFLFSEVLIHTIVHTCNIVGRICGKYKMDCGFGGKSTKIGIVDVKEVLSDFRYSAKLNFSPGVHKMTKSKMATNRSVNI